MWLDCGTNRDPNSTASSTTQPAILMPLGVIFAMHCRENDTYTHWRADKIPSSIKSNALLMSLALADDRRF